MSGEAPSIGLLVNPVAKAQRSEPLMMRRLERLMDGRGVYAQSSSVDELETIAEQFKARNIDVLALSGGDGTTSFALTAFQSVYGDQPLPAIALLRGGTMNTVANGIGVRRGSPEQLLRSLLEASETRSALRSKSVGTLNMNGQLGFITGVGVIPAFLKEYYEAGDPYPTPVTAFKLLSRAAAGAFVGGRLAKKVADRIACDVWVDGERWPTSSYLTIGAATVPQIGLGFTPFYRCDAAVDRFQLVGFTCSKVSFVRALWPIFRGQPTDPDYTRETLTSTATIKQLNGPTLYTIDGEVLEAEELVIGLGPRVKVVWA